MLRCPLAYVRVISRRQLNEFGPSGDWNLQDWKMTDTKMLDYTNTVSSKIFC